MNRPCAISPFQQITTTVSAKASRRNGKTTNLVHLPVIFSNQLLNSRTGSRSGSYAKMTGRHSAADGNNLGEFLDRVARQMLLGLHNATTLLLSPDPIKLQPAFFDRPLLAFGFAHSPSTENRFHANCLWCQFASFSPSGHPSRRESLRVKAPARRALSTVEPQTGKPAQRVVLLRTTLTGTDEPYNGRGDSRHDHLIYFTLFTGELLITSTFA